MSLIRLLVSSRSYATSKIDVKAFIALSHYDDWLEDHKYRSLMKALKEAGCSHIEWDGHFGPHVFFTLEADLDTERRRHRVLRIIGSYVQRASRWADKTGLHK